MSEGVGRTLIKGCEKVSPEFWLFRLDHKVVDHWPFTATEWGELDSLADQRELRLIDLVKLKLLLFSLF